MESAKNEPEKSDTCSQPKTPAETKAPGLLKIRINRNVPLSPSKIPKRDAGNVSVSKKLPLMAKPITRPISKPAISKPTDTKKSSKSMMSLALNKTTPRSHTLASSKSNMNTHRSLKSKEQTPRSQRSEPPSDKLQKQADRVVAKKNVLAFESMKDKVKSYQTEFMKRWEMVKSDISPEEGEYKLIGLVKNNDGHLVTKAAQKIKIKCPQKSLEDFKKDMQEYAENNVNLLLNSFDQLKNSSAKIGDSVKSVECLKTIEDVKEKMKIDNQNALEDILKQIESFESTAMNCELEVKVNKLLEEVDELRKNLDQSQKELSRIKKSDEDKGASYKKELEEKDKKLSRTQTECDELKKKVESLEKDVLKEKTLERELKEKLNNKTVEIEDLKKKLKACALTNVTQQNKNQEHETKIKKLETDLKDSLKKIEERNQVEHSIGDQATKHADEIKALKGNLSNSKRENEKLETEVLQLKKEIEKLREMDTQLLSFKDVAKQVDAENQILRQTIKSLENNLHAIESQESVSRDVNEELNKLQKCEMERNEKIDILEKELTKAHFQNKRLEEKITMDRKLLKVRCSLIESLQSKESTQKIHLEDLFAEVGERNNDIQMLKSELLTKTEEFQNLFSTLGAKQLELTKQEHMIKLLQESNERAQNLRVRQEAKIGHLEEELVKLKQTISLYQEAVLPNNVLRNNLLSEANRDGEFNDNLGYYVDERRRKRHIDINVKKYEK